MLVALEHPLPPSELRELVNSLDRKKDGHISQVEFMCWWNTGSVSLTKSAEDWEEQIDGEGNLYYLNTVNGASSWYPPTIVAAPEVVKAPEIMAESEIQPDKDVAPSTYLTEYSTTGAVNPSQPEREGSKDEQIRDLFAKYDQDGNGFFEKTDLSRLVQDMGFSMDDDEMTFIMNTLDIDQSGHISFDEFSRAYKNGEVVCEVNEGELDQWEECWGEDGSKYYYHATSGASSWFRPQFRQLVAQSQQGGYEYQPDGMNGISSSTPWLSQEESVKRTFREFDADGSGYIDAGEFYDLILALCGGSVEELPEGFHDPQGENPEVMLGIMRALDLDGSGYISEGEFLAWWLTGEFPTVFDDPQNWEERTQTSDSTDNLRTFYYNTASGISQYTMPRFLPTKVPTKEDKVEHDSREAAEGAWNEKQQNIGVTSNGFSPEIKSIATPIASVNDNLAWLFSKYGVVAGSEGELHAGKDSPVLLDEYGLNELLGTLGIHMSENEVHSLFVSMDVDGSGGVSWIGRYLVWCR